MRRWIPVNANDSNTSQKNEMDDKRKTNSVDNRCSMKENGSQCVICCLLFLFLSAHIFMSFVVKQFRKLQSINSHLIRRIFDSFSFHSVVVVVALRTLTTSVFGLCVSMPTWNEWTQIEANKWHHSKLITQEGARERERGAEQARDKIKMGQGSTGRRKRNVR